MRRSPVLLGLVLLGTLRCSLDPKPDIYGSDDGKGSDGDWSPGDGSASGGTSSGGGGYGGGAGEFPPEAEAESTYLSPVATGLYVWTANPTSDRVALVNAETLAVTSLEAGDQPTFIAAVPDPDPNVNRAVVLNTGSRDAMLFTATPGADTVRQRAPVHAGANAWSVSENGRWAVAWTRADPLHPPDPTEGFQDVTVIAIPPAGSDPSSPGGELRSWRLSVGYRPSGIVIAADETRVFVVCEPGVTILDLTTGVPVVDRDVPLSASGVDDPSLRDVSVTPDGAFALVRREGQREVGIVSLESGEIRSVALSGPVTDLDLLADGSQAIAVVRTVDGTGTVGTGGAGATGGSVGTGGAIEVAGTAGAGATGSFVAGAAGVTTTAGSAGASAGSAGFSAGAPGAGGITSGGAPPASGGAPPATGGTPAVPNSSEIAILELPAIFDAPNRYRTVVITNDVVGSVAAAPSGDRALLYTNAVPSDHLIIVDTSATSSAYRTVTVKVPIDAVFPTPDGEHAIVRLSPDPATSVKPGAFAVVPISSDLPPKIQTAEAPVQAVAIGPAPSTRAVVTASDALLSGAHATYVVRMPELQVDRVPLESQPLATGLVPAARKAFVAQQHPEGRITFIDLVAQGTATEITRTLTGFELAERVITGGN